MQYATMHSNVAGNSVIMENKIIQSQLPGDWPAYKQVCESIAVHMHDTQAPCTLLPPNAILHMIYVSSQGQCYVVEKNDEERRCYFKFLRAPYWLHANTPKNSLFAAIEFRNSENMTTLGFFDVLILNKQMLLHEHVFCRVQKLHELLSAGNQLNSNICFHFVGQQDCVLRHLSENAETLVQYCAVQLQSRDLQTLELVPLLPQAKSISSPHTVC
jgi:hypothetical protein